MNGFGSACQCSAQTAMAAVRSVTPVKRPLVGDDDYTCACAIAPYPRSGISRPPDGIVPVGRWRGFRCSRRLFQRPPARTRRASFPSNRLSSDHHVATGVPTQPYAGHHVPFRRSALRLPPGVVVSDHLVCFALWTAFPPALAGRDAGDYYQTSVALGLASRRRSHVRRPCCT
jgi:hypothetical protein